MGTISGNREYIMRSALIILTLTACAKGGDPAASGSSSNRAPQIGAHLPQDADSLEFIGGLVDLEIRNFRPGASTGAVLEYAQFGFRPDGSWSADGSISIGEDVMECTESGSWNMEPATSPTMAMVTWTLDNGNCSRASGIEMKARFTLEGDGEYSLQFR